MLITFEGIDGCGKTTQIQLLSNALKQQKIDFLLTKQPGGTQIGQQIRTLLLDPQNESMTASTELLLYLADRLQHIEEIIRPALKNGQLVLCDRYHDATLAYQGGGRQLDLKWLQPLLKQLIQPQLTFLFPISPEASQDRINFRKQANGSQPCRLESEKASFFSAVSAAYLQLAHLEPKRFCVIPAEQPVETIHQQVLEQVIQTLGL